MEEVSLLDSRRSEAQSGAGSLHGAGARPQEEEHAVFPEQLMVAHLKEP